MNLIGKIFVLVILLMSVLFMWLSMAVYSTHKNWQEAYNSTKTQLDKRDSEYKQLSSDMQMQVSELQREIDASLQDVSRLQSDRKALVARNQDIQTEINQLKQESRDATAAVSSTQANAERLANENTVLQRTIIDAQQASDDAFAKTVEATAKLHDAEVRLKSQKEMVAELTEQVGDMTIVMRENDLDPATRVGDVKPAVQGYVSLVRRRAGDETIQITIGSDDGIKPQHTIEIYRPAGAIAESKWLGRAVVLSTDGDKAYARIIPELKKGRIQEGDRVATRLN